MAATAYYLSELVPTSGLLADYSLADVTAAGDVTAVTDFTGNGYLLGDTIGSNPNYELDRLNGYPAIEFSAEAPLLWAGAVGPKHVFIVAKYDLAANFGGTFRGLLSSPAGENVLVGSDGASSTKFYNNAFGGDFAYVKSGVSYAEAAQEAPFTNFELIEASRSAAFTLDGIQLGQQAAFTGRRWYGGVAEMKLYSSVLSAAVVRQIRLYYDLKFHLFALNGSTLYFPDPTTISTTGLRWSRFDDEPRRWEDVTISHEYDDGGHSFNTSTNDPPRTWEIGFSGLTKAQGDIFDAFNDAARRDRTFSLIDKYGVTNTGLRIQSYNRTHDAHKSWTKEVLFKLVKYP